MRELLDRCDPFSEAASSPPREFFGEAGGRLARNARHPIDEAFLFAGAFAPCEDAAEPNFVLGGGIGCRLRVGGLTDNGLCVEGK